MNSYEISVTFFRTIETDNKDDAERLLDDAISKVTNWSDPFGGDWQYNDEIEELS